MVIQFAILAHEVLKHDWLKNNKHSWNILGVHGFPGCTVNGPIFVCASKCYFALQQDSSGFREN